jgi:glycosyltransferase involved in cell wall biosynthesis
MKKRILIISYYYPPSTGAPSWRAWSWASRFPEKGVEVVVVTRHFKGNESTWSEFIAPNTEQERVVNENGAEIHFLPTRAFFLNRFFKGKTWISNLYYFILATLGFFNPEIDAWLTFRKKVRHLLKTRDFDAVIITSPPSNILRLTKLIKRNSRAILIADIRDLWNNMMLMQNYTPLLKQKIWDHFYSFYYRRWLRYVDAVTMIIGQFESVLGKLTSKPGYVVYNGFEAALFKGIKKRNNGQFVFSVIGSLYPEQDLSIMLDGLKGFLSDKDPQIVKVRFIGLSALPEVAKVVQNAVPSSFITTTARVTKEDAVRETVEATVLSYAGWKGVKGIISTKIFDYMASGNPILIAPGDNDIIDRLLKESHTGHSVNTSEEFTNCLNSWYNEWRRTGEVSQQPDWNIVYNYSRENQADYMLSIIDSLIKNHDDGLQKNNKSVTIDK